MTGHFRISTEAEEDLVDIWLYIASDSPLNADRFQDVLIQCFKKLARLPGMGASREEWGAGLRVFPVGQYNIYYRSTDRGIEIARVLHAARDVKAILGDE